MRKKYYDLYKKLGKCVQCGKHKAEPNRVLCLMCTMERPTRKPKYNKERKAQYVRRKRDLCSAFGVCTTCLKRDAIKGKQCLECYLKRHRKYKEDMIKNNEIERFSRNDFGKCYICGEDVEPGYKLCKKHLEIARVNIQKGRDKINNTNHIWSKIKEAEIKKLGIK